MPYLCLAFARERHARGGVGSVFLFCLLPHYPYFIITSLIPYHTFLLTLTYPYALPCLPLPTTFNFLPLPTYVLFYCCALFMPDRLVSSQVFPGEFYAPVPTTPWIFCPTLLPCLAIPSAMPLPCYLFLSVGLLLPYLLPTCVGSCMSQTWQHVPCRFCYLWCLPAFCMPGLDGTFIPTLQPHAFL